jgi:hypothetical protein
MSTKNFFFFFLLAFAVVGFTACESDKCKDKDCGEGICLDDGACDCNDGYEYDAKGECKTLIEHKFVGGYIATETCSLSGQATPYGVSVAHGTSETDLKVTIKGAYGKDTDGSDFYQTVVNATVSGSSLTIASQDPDGDGFFIEGTGTIDTTSTPDKITMSYKVKYPNGQFDECNSTVWSKQ